MASWSPHSKKDQVWFWDKVIWGFLWEVCLFSPHGFSSGNTVSYYSQRKMQKCPMDTHSMDTLQIINGLDSAIVSTGMWGKNKSWIEIYVNQDRNQFYVHQFNKMIYIIYLYLFYNNGYSRLEKVTWRKCQACSWIRKLYIVLWDNIFHLTWEAHWWHCFLGVGLAHFTKNIEMAIWDIRHEVKAW